MYVEGERGTVVYVVTMEHMVKIQFCLLLLLMPNLHISADLRDSVDNRQENISHG